MYVSRQCQSLWSTLVFNLLNLWLLTQASLVKYDSAVRMHGLVSAIHGATCRVCGYLLSLPGL